MQTQCITEVEEEGQSQAKPGKSKDPGNLTVFLRESQEMSLYTTKHTLP